MPTGSWRQLCNEVQVGTCRFWMSFKPGVYCGREREGRSNLPPEFRMQALHRVVSVAVTWSPVGNLSHTQKDSWNV